MAKIDFEPDTLRPPASRPLSRRFAGVKSALPCLSLGNLPTPVHEYPALAGSGCSALFVKRDDLSALPYGGNKVRKLEFLLGSAIARELKEVMTFGVAGSNHALATAVCAARAGLRSISLLTPQTNSRYVAKNLLMSRVAGAQLHYYKSQREADAGARFQALRHKRRYGKAPMIIPGGGSCALGTIGFVNAALELAEQVDAGELPEPDFVYVALGTMGTVVGLQLGLRAAGLKTQVVAVRVVHENIANSERLTQLADNTIALLRESGASLPQDSFEQLPIVLRHDCFGRKYAVFTDEGMAAIARAAPHGLLLEGTYTGKAVAALFKDLDSGALRGKSVLFWHTYNSCDLTPWIAGADYRELPRPLRWYFENPVQRRDRI